MSSQREFPSILDVLRDAVLATDDGGRIKYANAAAGRLLGWPAAELIGAPLTAIMPERLRSAHEIGFRRYMVVHQSRIIGRPIRVPARLRDGAEIEVELTLSEVPGPGQRVIAVLRDLRERVELERKIAAQRKILAQYAAVSVLADATSAADAMPRILEATAKALEWDLGIYWAATPPTERLAVSATWSSGAEAANAFLARSRTMTFGPGDPLPGAALTSNEAVWSRDLRTDVRAQRRTLAAELGLRSALLFPVYCANRTWGVLEYVSSREEQLDEELRQTMKALGFQIGQFLERLKGEEELRRAWAQAEADRQNLRQLFEDAPAAIAIVRGPEMRYELSNAVNQELAGGRQLVGKTVREALPELEADGVVAVIRRVLETGEPFIAREYPLTLPEAPGRAARPMFMNGVCQPLHGATGAIEGVMVFSYDVTDLVDSRDRLREAEERLRLAVEAADVGTWDYDPRSGVIRADPRYRRLFGLGADAELTLELLRAAIHPEDVERVTAARARALDPRTRGEYALEYRIRGIEDGVERWVAVRGRAIFDERDRPVRLVGTSVDITREKRAVDRQSFLTRVSTVLSSSLDYHATLHQMVNLVIPRFADMCFIELTTEEGRLARGAMAHVDDAKARVARELRRRYPPELGPSPIARVLETGEPELLSVVTDEMTEAAAEDDEHLRMIRALEVRSMMLLPLHAREGTVAVLGLVLSESGRRYTEEDLAFAEEVASRAATAIENARLYERATKAVGVRDQFLSIASHELRTPLTALTLHLSALTRVVKGGLLKAIPVEKFASRVALMDKQASRLSALVDELLDVSRITSGRLELAREVMDLGPLVREVVARLAAEAAKARTSIEVAAPRPVVGSWDRSRVDQVVTNLVSNAIKYAPGAPISIEVDLRDASAVIAVRDHGPGIAEKDQKRIFRQFERAAPPARGGLGLGLWIANRIVEAHGGRIEVASQPGSGASFSAFLPLGQKP
jgi:PAS domain S-box-containing protein